MSSQSDVIGDVVDEAEDIMRSPIKVGINHE